MAADYCQQLLSAPKYVQQELWRCNLAYCDLDEADAQFEEFLQDCIRPELHYILSHVDYVSGYWVLESSPPELTKIFKENAANRLVGRVRLLHESEPLSESYAAVVEVSFRGTYRIANWMTNVTTYLVPTAVGRQKGKVHLGYQTAYLTFREELLKKIFDDLAGLEIQAGATVLVRVSGHSLGGAIATLFAYDLSQSAGHVWEIRCVTFGSPRIGNAEFANDCYEAVPRMARYINKMDLPSSLPANKQDPYDNSKRVSSLLAALSSSMQSAMKASDYQHVCPCLILDPSTSSKLYTIIAGMEVAVLAKEGLSEGIAEHVLRPHYIAGYVESLGAALESAKELDNSWAKLPSVGTWLMYPVETEAPPPHFLKVSSETQDFLRYGASLLSDFRGRGPKVLIDLHDHIGGYTKQQLAALGVEPDRFEKVPLETVLKSSPQLLHTEEGRELLRRAQEQLMTMLPMLALAAHDEESPQSQSSKQILAQLEKSGVAAKLLTWSREQIRAAESDPERLRNCLSSFNISSLTDLGADMLSTSSARLRTAKEQCLEILYSEATRDHLRAAGITLDDEGGVPLEQVLSKGQDLLKTEEGREVLRTAQSQALSLLAVLNAQAKGTSLNAQAKDFLQELKGSEQGDALIAWGQKTLAAAQEDPETLQGLLTSLDFSDTSTWTLQCQELLATGAKGLGLTFENGVLKLDGLIEKGQKYIESDTGTEFLREAQKKALNLTKLGLLEQASGYIKDLENCSETKNSRQLLESGRALLASAEEDPDALKKWLASIEASQANDWQQWGSQLVANNDGKRDELMKTVSEACSDFLSEQLHIIKVPRIESGPDATPDYYYCIDNIDLSSCSVQKEGFRIDLKSPSGHGETGSASAPSTQESSTAGSLATPQSADEILRVTAKDMKELKWQYEQKHFPYLRGHGTANTVAHGAQIVLAFELRSAKVNGCHVPRLALACSEVVIDKLVLSFKESSFSWLYNTIGYLFQDAVRDYVVSSLGDALKANMSSLLTPLNRYVHPYWPVVLSTVAIPVEQLPSLGVEEYTVELGLETEEALGGDFVDSEDGLMIIEMEEGGPLHRWNQDAPAERKVGLRDVLFDVDGKVGDEMIQALDKRPVKEMTFRRADKVSKEAEADPPCDTLDDFLNGTLG
ncbi:unnamed protein product [Effrenium voratum]|uniref:Fungal lipase-type domain-containing protein n=1 Tax=Effrenium voratum TaxID=2562239 RepID=A0AA36MNQ5_9DINO|nr:unnamed protein product [Effrenium voratum]